MATNPYALDATTRAGIITEAQRRAESSGRTAEQELYGYAKSQGIDDAGLDVYMGFNPGTTAGYAKANNGAGMTGAEMQGIVNANRAQSSSANVNSGIGANMVVAGSNTQPTADSPATPTGIVAGAAATGGAGATGAAAVGAAGGAAAKTPFTQDQRTWIIGEANKRAIAGGTSVAAEISKEATKNGLSMADAEIMMGYAPGTLSGGGAAGGGGGGGGGGGAADDGTVPAGTNALGGAVVPNVTPGAKLTDPSSYQAAQVQVTPDMTVEGRTAGIIAKNSPLMQQAESRAMQRASSRGLINSSLAVGAGQSAVLDAATNIASQDASTYANAAGNNAQATNQASQFNTGAQNQFAMADKAQSFDLAKMDKQASIVLSQMSAEQQNTIAKMAVQQGYNLETIGVNQVNDLAKFAAQVEAQNKQAETKYGYDRGLVEIQKASNLEIAGMESKYRQQIQASASATSIMTQLPTLIARVMENKDTDAAAKQAQINYHVATATAALRLAGQFAGDVDLSGSLDGILGLTP